MEYAQFFSTAIEVSIATAGFSGVVAILGQRGERQWRKADLARLLGLLQASFAAIFLSFLPLILEGTGVATTTIWRIGSACYIGYFIIAVPLRLRSVLQFRSENPAYSPMAVYSLFFLATLLAGLQVYNILVLASAWPFVLAIVLQIITALLAFVRLLRTLWHR